MQEYIVYNRQFVCLIIMEWHNLQNILTLKFYTEKNSTQKFLELQYLHVHRTYMYTVPTVANFWTSCADMPKKFSNSNQTISSLCNPVTFATLKATKMYSRLQLS